MILCAFAVGIGSLTVHRIRSDFNHEVQDTADQLAAQLHITIPPLKIEPALSYFASKSEHAVIRVLTPGAGGNVIAQQPRKAPPLGEPRFTARTVRGYRVLSRTALVYANGAPIGHVIIQYARRVSEPEATVQRVELFLLLGVLVGSGLALLAGMAIARRAMTPIAELTSTAAEIARTRDPSHGIPQYEAEDEVSELARTLEGMLRELDAARGETEAMLARQRQFVADASHELRTPLTSVLANLELLAESLHGDQGEAASSALRSSRRMRRLVGDLLLLARTDAARVLAREPCDLAQTVVEAASELGSVSSSHDIVLDAQGAIVMGARDDLHRLTINLIENALRHTPPGTEIRVTTRTTPDGHAELVVEDDGPGIPEQLAATLFERFVRGVGDRGGSFGLGLAIVHAVAVAHGGKVTIERSKKGETGARFVVRLPALPAQPAKPAQQGASPTAAASPAS
ncbi:MAG TPA: HAMP domain-containing sensor histidine kinase [Solirubrobacteraceae bacterium]|nr:HAMP domain-containing sensor histidine kinase [Solirubrobacteraceae bacterium]